VNRSWLFSSHRFFSRASATSAPHTRQPAVSQVRRRNLIFPSCFVVCSRRPLLTFLLEPARSGSPAPAILRQSLAVFSFFFLVLRTAVSAFPLLFFCRAVALVRPFSPLRGEPVPAPILLFILTAGSTRSGFLVQLKVVRPLPAWLQVSSSPSFRRLAVRRFTHLFISAPRIPSKNSWHGSNR